ncbi:MAG: TolB family protein [Fidelibacterota bacterium]
MKRDILFGLLFLLPVFGLQAQRIDVTGTVIIPTEESRYMAPQFSPDGDKILFTEFGYKGLWLYDLKHKALTQINAYAGAGYEPAFTEDGKKVVFRVDEYRKMRRYTALAVQTLGDQQVKYLSEKTRHLSPVLHLEPNRVLAVAEKRIQAYSLELAKPVQSVKSHAPLVYIEDQNIALFQNGELRLLAPLGKGNYIWPSLSPDHNRILFTIAGRGSYISDLDGKIIAELGVARAPRWSPDGKWVVCMVDEDDGHVITASDLWVVGAAGAPRIRLTHTTNRIEMHPNWSPDMSKIAFDTEDGQIGYLTIEIIN